MRLFSILTTLLLLSVSYKGFDQLIGSGSDDEGNGEHKEEGELGSPVDDIDYDFLQEQIMKIKAMSEKLKVKIYELLKEVKEKA